MVGRRNAPPSEVSGSCGLSMTMLVPKDLHDPNSAMRISYSQRRGSIASMRSFYSSGSNVGSSASNYIPSTPSSMDGQSGQVGLPEPDTPIHSSTFLSFQELLRRRSSSLPSLTRGARAGHVPSNIRPFTTAVSLRETIGSALHSMLQRFLAPSGESISVPETNPDIASVAQSVQSRRQVLDEIPSFLYYASEMIVSHAISAEKEGCDPSKLIDHLQSGDLWERWVSLRDDMSPSTSLLYFVAEHGLVSWASCLLSGDMRPNEIGGILRYPLIAAARKGNEEMVRLLLGEGADPRLQDRNGQTFLHHLAASSNKMPLGRALNQLSYSEVNQRDHYGRTPLHIAASRASKKRVEEFVKNGARIYSLDRWDNTPLHFASSRDDEDLAVLEYLMGLGASAKRPNSFGKTPFDVASEKGNSKSARFIREYGDSVKRRGLPPTSSMIEVQGRF